MTPPASWTANGWWAQPSASSGNWHGRGGHGNGNARWQEWAEWHCTVCGTQNWSTNGGRRSKTCKMCGCRKSYVQAASGAILPNVQPTSYAYAQPTSSYAYAQPTSHANAQQPSHAWRHDWTPNPKSMSIGDQLAEVASRLQACTPQPGRMDWQDEQLTTKFEPASASYGADRAKAVAKVNALTAVLADLPEGEEFDAERASLNQKLLVAKRGVTAAKPIGARIDTCRDALMRAQQNHAQAEQAVALAVAARDAAAQKVATIQSDLAELEQAVIQRDAEVDDSGNTPTGNHNSIMQMTQSLQAVFSEMNASGTVPAHVVAQTEGFMKQLLDGVQLIAMQASSTTGQPTTADDPVAEPPARRQRLCAKTRVDPATGAMTPAAVPEVFDLNGPSAVMPVDKADCPAAPT